MRSKIAGVIAGLVIAGMIQEFWNFIISGHAAQA